MDQKLLYTFRLYKRQFFLLFSILFVSSLPPQLLAFLAWSVPPEQELAHALISFSMMVLGLVFSSLGMGAVFYALEAGTHGASPGFVESFAAAMRKVFRLAIISIMMGLGIGIGAVFLLIPGIILWMKWSFAIPVIMSGRGEVGESTLSQSWNLTRGYAWQLFGATLVFLGPAVLITLPLLAVLFHDERFYDVLSIPHSAVSTLFYLPYEIFIFVCYREATLGPPDDVPDTPSESGDLAAGLPPLTE